ncbi:MAG: hypothetical protein IJO87_10490, partial [Eggerthellaceae bacterium]|nr:hypothetical protein [Eggerthellaceae bacterium]
AVPGMIETAYFSLSVENEDGSREHYVTTQTFYFDVLPNACQDTAGITQAYSSQIEQMIRYCHDTFTENEAGRQYKFDTNEAARQEASEAATLRANTAAEKVEQALAGDMGDLFDDYLDSKKDVAGGFPAWETYEEGIRNAGTPDDVTIGKDEENKLYVKDDSISYLKLHGLPLPYCGASELEDYVIETGMFSNAGEGWNSFNFKEPFEAIPHVILSVESGYGVEIKNVSPTGFLYYVTAGGASSVTKGTYYVHTTSSYSSTPVAVSLVTDVGSGGTATPDAVIVRYTAIEYGGE